MVSTKLQNAAAAVKNGVFNAAEFLVDAPKQRAGYDKVSKGIDTVYSAISNKAHALNAAIVNQGDKFLNAPAQVKFGRYTINEEEPSNKIALKNTANKIINFHEKVINVGSTVALKAGHQAQGLVHQVLTPIRFIAKLLQIEVAGKIIANSVALAVGYAVRGIVFAATQLGHIVPYALVGGIVGGTVFGLIAVAAKVSPLVALGIGLGLILLGQQAQIAILGKEVGNQTDAIRAMQRQAVNEKKEAAVKAADAAQNAFSAKAKRFANAAFEKGVKAPLNYANNNRVKTGIAAGITAAVIVGGVAGYYYGLPTFVTDAYNKAGELATAAKERAGKFVEPAYKDRKSVV